MTMKLVFDNYLKCRNGVKDHIRHGVFAPIDWGVWTTPLLFAERGSGIYYGNSDVIRNRWNAQMKTLEAETSLN